MPLCTHLVLNFVVRTEKNKIFHACLDRRGDCLLQEGSLALGRLPFQYYCTSLSVEEGEGVENRRIDDPCFDTHIYVFFC